MSTATTARCLRSRPTCACSPLGGGQPVIAGAVVDPSNAAAVGATVTEEKLPGQHRLQWNGRQA